MSCQGTGDCQAAKVQRLHDEAAELRQRIERIERLEDLTAVICQECGDVFHHDTKHDCNLGGEPDTCLNCTRKELARTEEQLKDMNYWHGDWCADNRPWTEWAVGLIAAIQDLTETDPARQASRLRVLLEEHQNKEPMK